MENRNFAGDLQISKVNKWYPGDVHAVKDMDMEIKRGEFIVFVGPSGCGKTTLLRMIAGLESISSGEVIMDGRTVNQVPPKNRDIAMVFQNYALYPNMKVKDNIAFPLKMQHIGKTEREKRVAEVAQKLELDALLERKPGALSGGQRQRVALARAMIRKPGLFLMDEPLANLDAKLRTEMRREIITLQRELGVTTIYVTHDQTEAMTMGTRIAVISGGVLQQFGTPQEIYRNPANLFVAGFIGSPNMNVWDTELISNNGQHYLTLGNARIPMGKSGLDARGLQGPIKAGIRPEHIVPAAPDDPHAVRMKISILENTGREAAVFLTGADIPDITMVTGADFSGRAGQEVYIRLKPEKILLFNTETGCAYGEYRIYSTGIETAAASAILIPILFLYQIFIFHNIKKTAAYIIFILYLTAMCLLVGFPCVTGIKIGWSYNFIPFYGMLNDITNSYLNVLLFIPLGIFVPCLWPEYRSMMKTVGLGLMTSLGIEILQIFTFRATDINDVITNVAGTMIGYLIGRLIIKRFPQLNWLGCKERELYLLYATVVVVMFFSQPFIQSVLGNFSL